MRVASKVGNIPSKFGHARPLGSRIIRYVCDGQTDRRTKATLTAPFPTGGGMTAVFWQQSEHIAECWKHEGRIQPPWWRADWAWQNGYFNTHYATSRYVMTTCQCHCQLRERVWNHLHSMPQIQLFLPHTRTMGRVHILLFLTFYVWFSAVEPSIATKFCVALRPCFRCVFYPNGGDIFRGLQMWDLEFGPIRKQFDF